MQSDYARWILEDRKAKSDLILSVNPFELKHCQTSKEVFDTCILYMHQKDESSSTQKVHASKIQDGGHVKVFDAVDKLEAMKVANSGDLLAMMLLY